MALDVDARDARRKRVGANRVCELAVAGVTQRDVKDEGDAEEDDDGPPARANGGGQKKDEGVIDAEYVDVEDKK